MKFPLFCVAMLLILTNCSSASKSSLSPSLVPSNLLLSTVISADSSGNVSFNATALNAISYDFDFGNGVIQTVPSGIVVYKYPASGNYSVNVIARSASGQTVSATSSVAVLLKLKLYWADEFNTDGIPDPASWGYDTGNGSGGWGNSELEYYTNRTQNIVVQGGMLRITAMKENYSGQAYTSARLVSTGKIAFTYGKVEMRAMLPAGVGTWPALWMLGANYTTAGWPACGEMDIMEQKGSELNKIYGTLHYPGHSGGNGNGATVMISNTSTQFHIYGMEWTPAAVKLSVDGVVFQTVVNSADLPFNHDFFFIFNVAMGGSFAGPVDPNFTSASMLVDYVRVYK